MPSPSSFLFPKETGCEGENWGHLLSPQDGRIPADAEQVTKEAEAQALTSCLEPWDGHSFESLLQRLPMCSIKCLSKTNSKHLTQGRAREVWKHFYSSQEPASNGRTSTACHSPPCACAQVSTLMRRERKDPDRGRCAHSLKPLCTLNPNSTTPHKESSK